MAAGVLAAADAQSRSSAGALQPVTGAPVLLGNAGGPGLGPALDKALENVSQILTTHMKLASLRTEKIYGALEAMKAELARVSWRQQLLWITYGIAANIHLPAGAGWM